MAGPTHFEPISVLMSAAVLAASWIVGNGIKDLAAGLRTHSEVGTYVLYESSSGVDGAKRLYRINTRTGKAWAYDESVILSSDAIGATGKKKESLDTMLSQARAQGKNVYAMPYWYSLDEEEDFERVLGTANERYTMH